MRGQIEVITGCMFSGKTEELIKRIKRSELEKRKVLVFKPKSDSRYSSENIVTNSGLKFPCIVIDAEKPEKILEYTNDIDVIAVDEVNLFNRKIVDICEELAKSGIRVIVNGLDLDFRGVPFPNMSELLAKADFVDKLQAVCVKCGSFATRTQRITNGKPAKYNEPVILIGSSDRYEARCRNCYEMSE